MLDITLQIELDRLEEKPWGEMTEVEKARFIDLDTTLQIELNRLEEKPWGEMTEVEKEAQRNGACFWEHYA